mgnify:CR=1 FL=1
MTAIHLKRLLLLTGKRSVDLMCFQKTFALRNLNFNLSASFKKKRGKLADSSLINDLAGLVCAFLKKEEEIIL